jgi:hypothetical protein
MARKRIEEKSKIQEEKDGPKRTLRRRRENRLPLCILPA